jgi:glycosyltransferase involved in cell wall biosynthesis
MLFRLLRRPAPDAYLVSYPGWFDVPLLWIVARLKKRPLVFDPFVSLHDTMITDRRLHGARTMPARMAAMIDRLSLRLTDLILADTPAHLDLFDAVTPGARSRGAILPLGADDGLFHPVEEVSPAGNLVMFHGTFVPLQGLATIIEAAALLGPDELRIVIIGDGQDMPVVEETMRRTGAQVELTGLVPLADLPARLARATVCLGVFGTSEKAGRVVPHKVYECLAMGRAVITRNGPAIRSMFSEGELVTVPPGDAPALAEAIRELIRDDVRREEVAIAGLEAYRQRFHEQHLAALLVAALESVTR